MKINADAVIVGTGVAGLFAALSLPRELEVVMITKADLGSVCSVTRRTMTAILRIRCVPVTTRTAGSLWTS